MIHKKGKKEKKKRVDYASSELRSLTVERVCG